MRGRDGAKQRAVGGFLLPSQPPVFLPLKTRRPSRATSTNPQHSSIRPDNLSPTRLDPFDNPSSAPLLLQRKTRASSKGSSLFLTPSLASLSFYRPPCSLEVDIDVGGRRNQGRVEHRGGRPLAQVRRREGRQERERRGEREEVSVVVKDTTRLSKRPLRPACAAARSEARARREMHLPMPRPLVSTPAPAPPPGDRHGASSHPGEHSPFAFASSSTSPAASSPAPKSGARGRGTKRRPGRVNYSWAWA